MCDTSCIKVEVILGLLYFLYVGVSIGSSLAGSVADGLVDSTFLYDGMFREGSVLESVGDGCGTNLLFGFFV